MTRIIAIVGMGYVGLPLAETYLDQGFRVIGLDKDENKLGLLRAGRSYIADVPEAKIKRYVETQQLTVTSDFGGISSAEAIIICVPTPLTDQHKPDMTYLIDAADKIGEHLQPGQLVALESSTYPGTTREVILPLLQKNGLTPGIDFFVGFSPERVNPGSRRYSLRDIPKIVSGITDACTDRTEELYLAAFQTVVRVSSTETAEMAKLLENTFRFVNISFINEFALLCDNLGINVWEVIEAASSKPFGFKAFYPGPGVGGHCIPVDPIYLQWKAQQVGAASSFIEISSEINRGMPAYIVSRLQEELNSTSLAGKKILVLGITFKEDVADIRESSVIEILQLLRDAGAKVDYHDPLIPEAEVGGAKMRSVELTKERLASSDGVILAVHHHGLPLQDIVHHAPLVFDTRNATAGLHGNARIVTLGGGKSGPAKR
ncbi:nucleotide sugar dehydrogenase [Paenibacillus sp. MBLB2552]|uniref:Nucleotide sugar dehydrogenase n=1 Tax=Paenibacillus mellifer TaxID=2937794 RepID=A0A9X1XZI3_9BACL|nr:nucleotide sugar dehydrogenase [Paenibacillus mellifer]MCK8488815.1 nucleotide sugar dehydrogenase [Paenibacillus mellifer]